MSSRLPIGVATTYNNPGLFDTNPPALDTLLADLRTAFTMRLISRTHALTYALVVIGTLQLQSCATVTTERPVTKPPATTAAEEAERTGEYVRAAQEYQRAAETVEEPHKPGLQLKAVETLVKAGQIHEAREKIKEIDTARLAPSLRARKHIVEAQIASHAGSHEEAIRLLDEAQRTRNLDPSLLSEIYRVRAEAEWALADPIGAAKNLIVRERYIVAKDAIENNQLQLWKILNSLPRATLKRELQVATDPILAGWIELAIKLIENAGRPGPLAQAIGVWKRTHPDHPVSKSLLAMLASRKPGLVGRVSRIALLLPLTSKYGVAAKALRDGVLAMDTANNDPDKPQVVIYDIGDDPSRAPDFYEQAVQDGTDFIIGPLGREAVDYVVKQANLTTPALLLGHTQHDRDPLPGHVFQFGLPPDQEARQAAERAYLDGHRQAVVLYTNTDWGERMQRAFADHWQQLGGILLTSIAYNPWESDHSQPIKRLLNIAQSEARRRTLEARLGMKLKFQSRRREDVDFIFLAADAKLGRLIKPQLNYHQGLNIPVYATSHIFSGKPDRVRDTDLDGISFGDMPWMLLNEGKIQALRQVLQGDWPYAHSQLDRLFALGMDSYAIIPHLNRISSENAVRFNGVTSSLSLGRGGRLHRQLLWAKFRKGTPELLDTFIQYTSQFQQVDSDTETSRTPAPRS